MTEQTRVEEEFTFLPTVILRLGPESLEVITVPKDNEERALLVLRGPEDAAGFQERTGYSAAEGFERIGMYEEAIASLLEKHGLRWVHFAAPWGSAEKGSLFTAEGFIRFLETCRPD